MGPDRTRIDKERYVGLAFMEREARGLWPHVWLVAGRSAAVARLGSRLSVVFGDRTVTVRRTEDGLVGEGVHVDESHGFVWVHLGEPETDVRGWLGSVGDALDAYRLGEWGQSGSLSIDLGANWKTVVDAWNETYHAQGIHRQILGMIDDVNVGFAEHGIHGQLVVPFAAPSPRVRTEAVGPILTHMLRVAGLDPRSFSGGPLDVRPAIQAHLADEPLYASLQPEQLTDCFNYYVFPNHSFVMWRDHMVLYRYRPHPTQPDRSWVDLISLQRNASESAIHVDYDEDDPRMEEVLAQDIAAIRATQQGMHSSGFDGLVLGDSEVRITRMHEELDALLDRTAPA